MSAHSAFRAALETGNVRRLRRIWASVMPHLPQPKTAEEAEIILHTARTAAESMSLKLRAYSHRWLTERGYESRLPDKLKPSAERLYPVASEGVGISCNSGSKYIRPALPIIQKAMGDAVEDCFANGDRDPELVKARMLEAKDREFRALFGRKL